MTLIQESFQRLFPEKDFNYHTQLEYNRRLSSFNANITCTLTKIKIHLNLQWKDIDDEIKIGLIQHLLLKVFKKKITTTNIQLYHNFIKNIPILTPKTKIDPYLHASFQRIQTKFLQNIELPNLQWGADAKRKLAHYNFHNDTVTLSSLFKEAPQHIIDYLMYHELLHKKHQFNHKNGRSSYHNKQFREEEAIYPNFKQIDKEISLFLRTKHKKSFWQRLKENI